MSPVPKGYSKNLPRVSEVVSAFYPFAGDSLARYEGWLASHGIRKEDYLSESQTIGTWVHKKIEDAINGKAKVPSQRTRKAKLVSEAIRFLKDNGLSPVETEKYIRTKWYQGTCDLLAIDGDGRKVIVDWKTWGAAKWKWKLPYKYQKNAGKIAKVRFQMSLYSYGLKADYAYAVELRDDGYRAYKLELMDRKSVKSLMEEYGKTIVR